MGFDNGVLTGKGSVDLSIGPVAHRQALLIYFMGLFIPIIEDKPAFMVGISELTFTKATFNGGSMPEVFFEIINEYKNKSALLKRSIEEPVELQSNDKDYFQMLINKCKSDAISFNNTSDALDDIQFFYYREGKITTHEITVNENRSLFKSTTILRKCVTAKMDLDLELTINGESFEWKITLETDSLEMQTQVLREHWQEADPLDLKIETKDSCLIL